MHGDRKKRRRHTRSSQPNEKFLSEAGSRGRGWWERPPRVTGAAVGAKSAVLSVQRHVWFPLLLVFVGGVSLQTRTGFDSGGVVRLQRPPTSTVRRDDRWRDEWLRLNSF
ncbi:unnamed protein product, partial [Ixodes pacificus]